MGILYLSYNKNMKINKLFVGIFCLTVLLVPIDFVSATQISLADRLSGRILLQVESYGRAWYVYPKTGQRYYLKDGQTAYEIMRSLGLGITNEDLEKIPTQKEMAYDKNLVKRVKGYILLAVQQHGEAWYVNPQDGLRYYLKDGQAAYELMRKFALGITDENLRKIPINNTQIVADYAFGGVAHVKYDGKNFSHKYFADVILPLASMTKLMTALVILDTKPDWDRLIILNQEQLNYPIYYAGQEATSEVAFAVGDQLTVNDLWTAMLLASSNQAAVALADSTGLSRTEFVKLMNKEVRDLGLTKTIFYEVTGLDAHNVATSKEMAIIAHTALSIPKIADTTILKDYLIAAVDNQNLSKTIKVSNRNYSLMDFKPDGTKTGYLTEAQRTVALKKGIDVVVVMHARSMTERNSIIKNLLK